MKRRVVLMVAAILLFIGVIGLVKFLQIRAAIAAGAAFQMPPEAVTTVVAKQEEWPATQRAIGTVEAVHGVIVSADGTILTNAHVIEGAERVTIMMADNKTFEAKLVGTDKPSDLAVLKIEAQNMPYLTLGNSDTVRVGDIVQVNVELISADFVSADFVASYGVAANLVSGDSIAHLADAHSRARAGGAILRRQRDLPKEMRDPVVGDQQVQQLLAGHLAVIIARCLVDKMGSLVVQLGWQLARQLGGDLFDARHRRPPWCLGVGMARASGSIVFEN